MGQEVVPFLEENNWPPKTMVANSLKHLKILNLCFTTDLARIWISDLLFVMWWASRCQLQSLQPRRWGGTKWSQKETNTSANLENQLDTWLVQMYDMHNMFNDSWTAVSNCDPEMLAEPEVSALVNENGHHRLPPPHNPLINLLCWTLSLSSGAPTH